MQSWWKTLGIGTKLNIPIQVMLVIVLSLAHLWVIEHIKRDILEGAERSAIVSADGVINGMNMLMVTGMISVPENRRLFIAKMGASENVKELRIIRAKQVQDQFGAGLPEEQARDDMDRRAMESKTPQFLLDEDKLAPTLRTVVPFIVSTNFRGTNCLMCHHVEVGSVNGAASVIVDMSEEFATINRTRVRLLTGQIALQIVLFFSVHWLIRRFMNPILKLQSTMESMKLRGSMEQFVPLQLKTGSLDEFGKLTEAFNHMSVTLCESEKSLRLSALIYQTNADAIVVTDESNHVVDINPAFTRITGYTLEEIRGKDPKILKSGRHDKEFYRQMWQSILNEGCWQGEIWDKRKDGGVYAKYSHITVLRRTDGTVYRYVAQFSDITEKKQKDELIFWQANYDPLTNLPNRRLLNDRLGQAMAASKRSGQYGALIFMDLDNFKPLNDLHGHDVGDLLLREAAHRISSCVRETDTVARFGGDEFVVVLSELDVDKSESVKQASSVAEKIRATLAEPYALRVLKNGSAGNTIEHHCTSSIGVVLFINHEACTEDVIKWADTAMYQAKEAGRNSYIFYDAKT